MNLDILSILPLRFSTLKNPDYCGVNITRDSILTNQTLSLSSDAISEAHVRIQADFEDVNPILYLGNKVQ